jgi:DNA polymerase-4
MAPRIILHVDMDAFFAAIEQRDRPELRGKPVIVGGTPQSRGVVSTASYEARKFGVHSAMPAARAVRLCPYGVFLPVDGAKYHAVSQQVMAILARHARAIEQVSIDEAFLDLTGMVPDFQAAEALARRIKSEIKRELLLTASVGVGGNKYTAKLASDLRKPDGLVVIRPEEAEALLAPLPVSKLWGVGPKTEKRLQSLALRTIGDIARTPIERLRALLGAWGDALYELAHGIDERPVETSREVKSVSSETTFPQDLYDIKEMRRVLAELSREVARRLQDEQVRARTVAIKVRFSDFHTITRQTSLPEATDRAEAIRRVAHRLLDCAALRAAGPQAAAPDSEVDRGGQGIRLLGVRGAGLESQPEQLSLFDPRREKRAQLERSLSYIRQRFGEDAVRWARDAADL